MLCMSKASPEPEGPELPEKMEPVVQEVPPRREAHNYIWGFLRDLSWGIHNGGDQVNRGDQVNQKSLHGSFLLSKFY